MFFIFIVAKQISTNLKLSYLLLLTVFIFFSCKNKSDKAIDHLTDWFNGFDSIKAIDEKTKCYFKTTDLNTKEVAVESIIIKELDLNPSIEKIAFLDSTKNITRSFYSWENNESIIKLDVLYPATDINSGILFQVTHIKK